MKTKSQKVLGNVLYYLCPKYWNTKIKTKSQKVLGNVFYYLGPKYSNTKINFKSYEHLNFFSAIIYMISRLYGHTTGLVLNTKMKTKSQKVQGNILYYLGPKYWNTNINFKSYVHLKFFLPSVLWFQDVTVTSQA
jgi:hypothetical protein